MSRAWIGAAIAGLAIAIADAVVALVWPDPVPAHEAIAHVAVGATWIGAGLVAWARHPELRIGPLMAAVGFTWYLTELWWPAAVPATVFYLLDELVLAVALHAVLAFPSGRLRTRLERVVVAGGYATVLVGNLASVLVWDPARSGCAECARNLLLVQRSPFVDDVLSTARPAIGVALGAVAVTLLVRRWRFATAAGRAVLGPVCGPPR